MLATISGPISTSYSSFSKLSWIQTTFPIGASISQPLSGHLTDIFGRRKGLVLCYVLFATGTLLCGLAPNLGVFLLGRIVEGLGGGAIVSITAFVESDLFPLRKRALIEGLGNIAYGVTFALGGIYGGAINEAIGWRWTFLIQPPIIAINAVLVFFVVSIPPKASKNSLLRRIDYFGSGTLVLAIVLFQLGLNSGGTTVGWDSPLVIITLTIAGISFGLFIFWDFSKASNPVIPIRALLQRTVASAQMNFFFTSAANISILFYMPIYLQVLGHSTGESGLRFIPMAIALCLSSFTTGFLVKMTGRYYYINIPVQISSIVGAALLCKMTQQTPSWFPFMSLAFLGVGLGGASVTRLMGILSSVDEEQQAVIQAASWTIESMGLAFGITIASTIFQKTTVSNLHAVLGTKPDLLRVLTANFEALKDLRGVEKQAIIEVYLKASRNVFYLALAEIVFAAVVSCLMENNRLADEARDVESELGALKT